MAVTVAELSAAQFQAVKSQLRGIGIEGLVVARRSGREIRAGRRTATLWALTPCRVAVIPEGLLDREALAELAKRRLQAVPGGATIMRPGDCPTVA